MTQPRPSPPPLALLFSCATSRSCPFAHPCVLSLFSCFSNSFWGACAAVQVLGQGGVLVRGACAQPRPCSIFSSLSLFLASPPCCLAPAWPSRPARGPQPSTLGPARPYGPCAVLHSSLSSLHGPSPSPWRRGFLELKEATENARADPDVGTRLSLPSFQASCAGDDMCWGRSRVLRFASVQADGVGDARFIGASPSPTWERT